MIEEGALRATGKTEAELRDSHKLPQKQLIENFFDWTKSVRIKNCICQNPNFDWDFIVQKARKYGLKAPFHYRTFDLHSFAQARYIQLNGDFLFDGDHSKMDLPNILKFCGLDDKRIKLEEGKIVKVGRPHNALEDAKLTAEAFSRIVYGKSLLDEYSQYKLPEYLQ